MKNILLMGVLSVLLTACAAKSVELGNKQHKIDCSYSFDSQACVAKAKEICPKGYRTSKTTELEYFKLSSSVSEMYITCK